ncbi:MAG: TonB-dependent receptor [Sediminibacterium sp.]|nr:MAG: TonB-dependent receptor [Sediminibacterium sp.] [Sediminibacterium sp. FEMGT703S]
MQKFLTSFLLFVGTVAQGQSLSLADTLKSTTTTEVTVIANKQFVKTLVDKTVLNIAAKPSSAGQNALELLKIAPGVVVDPNENIQMGGKNGVTVLIDNQNTQLSAQDLAQLLKSIESDNIKEIEIIINPSAKYDAAGNAGIINIILKKSLTNGFNGSVTGNFTQSTHNRSSGSTNLNFRKNKWNWFGNFGINDGYQETIANNDRKLVNQQLVQRGIEKDQFGGSNFRAGIDYSVNKKTTIGFLWLQNTRFTNMNNYNLTAIQQQGILDTNVVTNSIAPNRFNRNNYNVNYRWVNGNQQSLNIDADYSKFFSGLNNQVTIQAIPSNGLSAPINGVNNEADVNIEISSIRADYTQKLTNQLKLEAGFKSVYSLANNGLLVSHDLNGVWKADTGKSNQFQFKEYIHAVYLSVQANYQKWSFQAGLRAEQTTVNGLSTSLLKQATIKPDTAYLNLFPSLFVQYQLKQNHQLGFTITKRIDRPNYQDQNPFIYQLDAFNSEQGNPYLIPQITYGAELSYTYKYATNFKIQYGITNNYIEQLTYQVGKNTIQTPQNAGTRKMLNISISSPVPVNNWWNMYVSLSPFYQSYQVTLNGFGTIENRSQSSWGMNGYMSQNFSLGKNWNADISGWYNFQNATTIYQSKALGSINLGVSKKILKEKATIKFAISDLLNTQRWEQTATTSTLDLRTYRKWESRNIAISFSYRFGNNKIKTARERETGSSAEMDRIKQ